MTLKITTSSLSTLSEYFFYHCQLALKGNRIQGLWRPIGPSVWQRGRNAFIPLFSSPSLFYLSSLYPRKNLLAQYKCWGDITHEDGNITHEDFTHGSGWFRKGSGSAAVASVVDHDFASDKRFRTGPLPVALVIWWWSMGCYVLEGGCGSVETDCGRIQNDDHEKADAKLASNTDGSEIKGRKEFIKKTEFCVERLKLPARVRETTRGVSNFSSRQGWQHGMQTQK